MKESCVRVRDSGSQSVQHSYPILSYPIRSFHSSTEYLLLVFIVLVDMGMCDVGSRRYLISVYVIGMLLVPSYIPYN